jgi:hypothetical protein
MFSNNCKLLDIQIISRNLFYWAINEVNGSSNQIKIMKTDLAYLTIEIYKTSHHSCCYTNIRLGRFSS